MELLSLGNAIVKIDEGELVGYVVGGHEYIHQKGSPGWRSSDTEMFPIIGPTADAKYQVETPKGIAIQDQHGLLRELAYEPISITEDTAIFQKKYMARTQIKNSKYPDKSPKALLYWPYDFKFQKKFQLFKNKLEITFLVSGDRDTPFMLGYHPAFKLYAKDPTVITNDRTITLPEILAVGSRALQVPNCTKIILMDQKEIHIETEGFGNFMLWTEVPNMLCIEPITYYPYAEGQKQLHEGFQYLYEAPKAFKVSIQTNS